MKTDQGDHPGKWILLIYQAFAGLPPCKSKEKLSCLARLGTNWIRHQTHLSAVRLTTQTFLFKAYRKSLRKIKGNDSDVGFIRATPLPLAEAGKSTSKGPSTQMVQQLMCLHWPPAALHRRISPRCHNFLGLWGHQVDPSRRMNSCLRVLRKSTSPEDRHQSDLPCSPFAETKLEEEFCIILLAQRDREADEHDKNLTPKYPHPNPPVHYGTSLKISQGLYRAMQWTSARVQICKQQERSARESVYEEDSSWETKCPHQMPSHIKRWSTKNTHGYHLKGWQLLFF